MPQSDREWDRLLGVKTTGRDASISNHINYPYEPTPYPVLERLAQEGYIGKRDTVLDSYYARPREIRLFFYYPSDEYLAWLMTQDPLLFADEIDCRDLYEKPDEREKILVFEIGGRI